jgi:hypothetical protein
MTSRLCPVNRDGICDVDDGFYDSSDDEIEAKEPMEWNLRTWGEMIRTRECYRTTTIVCAMQTKKLKIDGVDLGQFLLGKTAACRSLNFNRHRYIVPTRVVIREIWSNAGRTLEACLNIKYVHAHTNVNDRKDFISSLSPDNGYAIATSTPPKNQDPERTGVYCGPGVAICIPGDKPAERSYTLYELDSRHSTEQIGVAVHTVCHRGVNGCIATDRNSGLVFMCDVGTSIISSCPQATAINNSHATSKLSSVSDPKQNYTSRMSYYRAGAKTCSNVPVIDTHSGLLIELQITNTSAYELALKEIAEPLAIYFKLELTAFM